MGPDQTGKGQSEMEGREKQDMVAHDHAHSPASAPDAAAGETMTETKTKPAADVDNPKPDRPLPVPTPATTASPSTPFAALLNKPADDHNTLTPESFVEENNTTAEDSGVTGPREQAPGVGLRPVSPIMSLDAAVNASAGAKTTTAATPPSQSASPSNNAANAPPATNIKIANPAENASGSTDSGTKINTTTAPTDLASLSPPSPDHRITEANPLGAGASGAAAAQPQRQLPDNETSNTTTATPVTTATPSSSAPEHTLPLDRTTANNSQPSTPLGESPPLFSSSILPATKLVQPKPIGVPVSASNSLSTKTPFPDYGIRSGCPVGSVAQLEATAERLSTGTSSIGDAIRELHGELKRSDSRRSSKLAASVIASNDDPASLHAVGQLKRHLSNSSSIVSTNIAARHGGYSPAGFIMSPTHSLSGRLRSGSNRSAGRPDVDSDNFLSRHGPGKSSVRSVRSTKMSLAEISESEPISLTKAALDAGEAAPPIHLDIDNDNDDTIRPFEPQNNQSELPSTDAFHAMLDDSFAGPVGPDFAHQPSDQPASAPWDKTAAHNASAETDGKDQARPSTSYSNDSEQQAMDAFVDFDGVHWEPEQEWDLPPPPEEDDTAAHRHTGRAGMGRPQSYLDPDSGQQMLYYPARVPALLNLPPKLSSKPKVAQRNHRQSQLLNAMADADQHYESTHARRRSEMPAMTTRDSWLPDPLAGHRESFMALPQDEPVAQEESQVPQVPQAETPADSESPALRVPQRLSRNELDPRKSRVDNLPPQLRASAYFDLPSKPTKMEIKDGSAMATLDSMLDASMNAPVSAFTDHSFAGKLGAEVYGKAKKRKSKLSLSAPAPPMLSPEPPKEHKKRSSLFWFKRSTSYNGERDDAKSASNGGAPLGSVNGELDTPADRPLTSSVDGESIRERDRSRDRREGSVSDRDDQESNSDDVDADDYNGPPTTLLAELQLRKQQQRSRTQPLSRQFPNGMHATLLEMDAVAEVERKNRKGKRVNLAWEAPDAHLDQNGSDDEDVPLAVIAAKHQGAKNMADLERPIGLMEKREMEENEPLSRRKARLQGQDPMSMVLPKRQSLAALSAHIQSNIRPLSAQMPRSPARTPEPESEPVEEEIEGETLGERKRRLEAKELPKARPVSSAFSTELLSQFGDVDEVKAEGSNNKENQASTPVAEEGEEETLGQRKRRLQAESQAREREMSYGNLVGQPVQQINHRLSMADMLSAHPKKEDPRALAERQRAQQEAITAREREAKMAAMRMQMPQTLTGPSINRSGGFGGGAYNDGRGGTGQAPSHFVAQGFHNRNQSQATLSAYGMPVQQNMYAPAQQYGHYAQMGGYPNNYGNNYPYAQQQPGMQMQMPANPASMNRVEQWRHGVVP